MGKLRWGVAPEGAEYYADGYFRKGQYYWNKNDRDWVHTDRQQSDFHHYADYEENPEAQPTQEWPATDERIDRIGRDRTSEDMGHYPALEPTEPKTSAEYLSECLRVQTERGKQYDASGTGERSFAAAASAFNAATGKSLTGSDVCLLLVMVKLVRQYSSPDRLHQDSLLDGVSYMSLWAEMLTKELTPA